MTEQQLHKALYPEAHAKPEYIICAAIHFDDDKKHLHQPKNIDTGIVLCGRRHHNVIINWNLLTGEKTTDKEVQGFVTSKDRFVDRKEGAIIASAAGQVARPAEVLFSEDLY